MRRSSKSPFRFSRQLLGVSIPLFAAGACTPCPSAAPANAPVAATPAASSAAPAPKTDWLLEDFERAEGRSGPLWLEFDKNGLGTRAAPFPFQPEPGGASGSPGHAAHITGALGSNKAPWSWVQLQVHLNPNKAPQDLNGYKTLRFFVKADGGRYSVALEKASVTDHDHFRYEFTAPSSWTEIVVPLAELAQAGWGKPLPRRFDDVLRVRFSPAEFDKPFDFAVDHLVLSPTEVKLTPKPYATADWFPWTGIDASKRRGTALDVSRLLDAPAGKHGALGRRGENFVFADGKKARFWGVNIVASANFPTHEEADKLAELLAQLGVNMTRHHHIDAAWSTPNVFGNKANTLALDPAAMDRFDYFVAALQKRGIYQFFDMLVHRKVTKEDGVAEADKLAQGLKIEGEFDPKLIELQEKFIDQFMGHENPYTKSTYAKNPAIALVEVINEDSLLWLRNEGDFALKTPASRQLIAQLFSAWLKKQVPGGRAALEKRWADASGKQGLLPSEDPEKGSVELSFSFEREVYPKLGKARLADTLRFLYDTELDYYKRIQKRLKQVGYRGLTTGSNHWTEHPLDLMASAELDFVDRHAYFSHPEAGWGYNKDIRWNPSSMLKDPYLGIVGSLAHRRVKGLPYSTSEWQTSAPNDYRQEGVLLMGAYAALQGMSPIEFAFSHDVKKRPEAIDVLSNNFDIIEQPAMLGLWPAVSLLFHRADVRESDLAAYVKVDREASLVPEAALPAPAKLGLIARTGVDFSPNAATPPIDKIVKDHTNGTMVSSSTRELRHDSTSGRFEMDTPRSQGFAGFNSNETVALGNVRIDLKSPYAVVVVSSLEDAPIATTRRWLVTAAGNAVNTGMALAASGNALADPGRAPILVEPIVGNVTLGKITGALDKLKAYALLASGERGPEVPLTRTADGFVLPLSAASKTLHYEIVRQ
ncbi:MAG: CIA30 family protein [Myxococcota bacterium]